MSKTYIRTKDRIYELKDNSKYGDLVKTIGLDNFLSQNYKQSNNLAELCDEFVVHVISKETEWEAHHEYDDFDTFKGAKIKEGYKGSHYGAIWTDKGLIYVAKMNEDGELVLI